MLLRLFDLWLVSWCTFTTSIAHTFHKDLANYTENNCSLRNYCCVFGQICPECKHVNQDFDDD